MWPWEHLAFGYLLYSGYTHARFGRPPGGRATLALVVATQVPDLIDKPLAWAFELLPSGYSLGHSLLFALPVIGVVLVVARRFGRANEGGAFAFGYLSHLAGDAVYPVAFGDGVYIRRLLWPLVSTGPSETGGLLSRVAALFVDFVGFLGTPQGFAYLLGEGALLLLAVALWLYDGKPGFTILRGR